MNEFKKYNRETTAILLESCRLRNEFEKGKFATYEEYLKDFDERMSRALAKEKDIEQTK